MKAFLILSLLALAFVSSEELHFLSDDELDTDGFVSNGFEDIMKGGGQILDLVERVINIFKSGKTSVIKERIEGKGFSYFKGGCTVQSTNGLLVNRYGNFMDKLLDRINFPLEKREKVKGQMEDVLDTDSGVAFKTYDLFFNAGSSDNDNCNSLSFIAGYNARGSLDVFVSNMHADFKLAKDITILTETKSYVGGLWSESKDVIKETPKNISQEDIKIIIAFFEYIGLEQFADFMHIKIPSLH